jgi:hypothetical protein
MLSEPVLMVVLGLVGFAARTVSLQFRLSRERAWARDLVNALRPVRSGSLAVDYRADGAIFVRLTVPPTLGGVSGEA